jgi:hypothetical protein
VEEILINEYQELLDKYRIRHFTALEIFEPPLNHKLGTLPNTELWKNSIPTILIIDEMRDFCDFPIIISSSYRNEKHNRVEGGSTDSMHIYFNAFDIYPALGSRDHLKKMILFVEDVFFYKIKYDNTFVSKRDIGFGKYHNRLHIDSRGKLNRPSPKVWGK